MLTLLGSGALTHHTFGIRKPLDVDLLGTYEDIQKHIKYVSKVEKVIANYPTDSGRKIIVKTIEHIREYEVCWEGSDSEALLKIIENDKKSFVSDWEHGLCRVPDLDILYMLKMSHRYRKDSIFFKKTLDDILLMRKLGAKIRPEHQDWYEWRQRETYQNVLPKLNQSKKEFFDNSASIYTLDHDSIHEAVKHLPQPAYEYFKPDTAEVMTSKVMFFRCPREVQIYAAVEEVMVLSIERAIHPFKLIGEKRRWAFDMAHMKLATSISSGWFREFVWENYYEVQAMYSEEYVDKFYDALHNGRIKPFESV